MGAKKDTPDVSSKIINSEVSKGGALTAKNTAHAARVELPPIFNYERATSLV